MLTKLRDQLYIADVKVSEAELKKEGIGVVVGVYSNFAMPTTEFQVFVVGLALPSSGRINRPYVKDIACHIPKYMIQNGEKVAVIGETGLVRAAFVCARAICEMEDKSIYDIFLELQSTLEGFEIGNAYL